MESLPLALAAGIAGLLVALWLNGFLSAMELPGGGTTQLDSDGNFSLANLAPAQYSVELLNRDGKVVCTEGPYNLTQQLAKDSVNISCNKVPAAWWLIGAAAAAGITAGVLTASSAQ